MVTNISDRPKSDPETETPKRRGRPRQFDETELLDRAVDLLWREGPAALSLNDLAARLGVAKPALARTFGGKDDLLATVLRRYRARIDDMVLVDLENAVTTEEIARAYLMSFAEGLSAKPVGPATGCLLAATTDMTALEEGVVAQTARALNAEHRARLEAALARVGSVDPTGLGTFLYGQSIALAFLSRSGAGQDELRAFADRAVQTVAKARPH